ncbi:MAG: thiamine phosphate synthase [Blastocatellia bacterium]|nr:thiamine phosphate synthase [Blastocatellia bacterium]
MNILNQQPLSYLITDRQTLKANSLNSLVTFCQQAADAGVDLIQIREKDLETDALSELVELVLLAVSGSNTKVLVNDRLDVALSCGADGVHLRSTSFPPDEVRKICGDNFLIASSTHSVAEAIVAAGLGADLVVLGPVFDTPSKKAYGTALGLKPLMEAVEKVSCPIVALGGIDLNNASQVLACNVAGIAGIRLFSQSENLKDTVRTLKMMRP